MLIQELQNTKIYLSNIDDRILFQEKMFNLGIVWRYSGEVIKHLDIEFYGLKEIDGKLVIITMSKESFMEPTIRWITLQDALRAHKENSDIKADLDQIFFNIYIREKRELKAVELEFKKRKQELRASYKVSDEEREDIIALVKEKIESIDSKFPEKLNDFKFYLQGRNDLNFGFKLACIQLFYKMM